MDIFNVVAIIVSLAALLSFVNVRFVKLPSSIGLLVIALVISLGLIGLRLVGVDMETPAKRVLDHIDFSDTLLKGMLSFLLFAGAIHIRLDDLMSERWMIGTLATAGVVLSAGIVGFVLYFLLPLIGTPIPLIYCFIFGVLISPTDPIAVLAVLKTVDVHKPLEMKIAGESLFNDGISVVLFITLLGIATGRVAGDLEHITLDFLREMVGGFFFGLVLGLLTSWLLKQINNYQTEILLSLATVSGGYAFASFLGVSGPIAIVVAGLFIGNYGREHAMSEKTREHLDMFWELIDEFLNTVLFVLIGFEILVLSFNIPYLIAGFVAVPVVLFSRFVSVGSFVALFKIKREFSPHAVKILTWGGLRGGISFALALALPYGEIRDTLLMVTYIVVVSSILVQGLTIRKVLIFFNAKQNS